MLVDGRTVPQADTIDADVCVVGGGPAGISFARHYVQLTGGTVALIETGGVEFDVNDQDLADADVEGHDYYPVRETRVRMLGGSTISWGGIVAPLDRIDFEERAWVPNSGWPITRHDVDPYYEKAFAVCDVDPSDSDSSVDALGAGSEVTGPTLDTVWDAIYFSAPTRFGKLYRKELSASERITTYLNTTATAVRLHPDGRHVVGIEMATTAGNRFTVSAKHYVLAGGGIENARLLLTSTDVQRAGIGNGHDLVGRYFQEHPRIKDRYGLDGDSTAIARWVSGAAGTLRFSRLGLSEDVQKRDELLNFIVNLAFGYAGQETPQFEAARRIVNASRSPWSDSPYYQDTGGGPNRVRGEDIRTCLRGPIKTVKSLVGAALRPPRMRRWLEVTCSIEQVPRASNRIVLTDDLDKFGIPKAKLLWTLDAQEERTYRRGTQIILEALEQFSPGIAGRRFDYPDPWPDEAVGTWHHIGTTRMADHPSKGVVDRDCKVHGVDNLFIAGSSIFPASGATAPTLTIIALGLRLAEHLRDEGAIPTTDTGRTS